MTYFSGLDPSTALQPVVFSWQLQGVMSNYSYLTEDESLQLALALSLSAAQESQQDTHLGSCFERPALELVDTSKDEELARQLQEELLLQERAEDGGATHTSGASAGSEATASAPPHPQQQTLPQQQAQQPALGRRPNPSPLDRLLGGVASKLPSGRWAGSSVSPTSAVPASGRPGGPFTACTLRMVSCTQCLELLSSNRKACLQPTTVSDQVL